MNKTLVVIGGPTAVGKTSVAINLAKALDTDILSADSRQCYRELTIGTAKPSPDELAAVPHHFINSHSIKETVSAGDYSRIARKVMENVFRENDYLVMAGGTGLYIRAALDGIDDMPVPEPALREELNQLPLEQLQKKLEVYDPDYFKSVDINNPQRLVRALEVSMSSGKPYSSFLNQKKEKLPYTIIKIALNIDRSSLYDRINKRVDDMISTGLINEAKSYAQYSSHYALQTVGYSEIFSFLNGELTENEAIESIKKNTRRYAKRQLTWFRKNDAYTWFAPENGREIVEFVKEKSH